jgi:hypothetical protein
MKERITCSLVSLRRITNSRRKGLTALVKPVGDSLFAIVICVRSTDAVAVGALLRGCCGGVDVRSVRGRSDTVGYGRLRADGAPKP